MFTTAREQADSGDFRWDSRDFQGPTVVAPAAVMTWRNGGHLGTANGQHEAGNNPADRCHVRGSRAHEFVENEVWSGGIKASVPIVLICTDHILP